MNVRYIVELTPEERDQLKALTVGGVEQALGGFAALAGHLTR
jgi:hypothetical protein